MMFLSFNKPQMSFVFVAFLIFLIFPSLPKSVNASPVSCICPYGYPTPMADSAGMNQCECSPSSYCEEGFYCCTTSFPSQISQDQFDLYRKNFVMNSFYKDTVTPDFKDGADEARKSATLRLTLWGTFLDASIFNDTLKDMGILTAQTLHTYTPSEQICKFGTLSRALSASEAKMDTDRLALSEIGLAKNLGRKSSISAAGAGQEFEARLKGFVDRFCNLKSNNNGMAGTCQVATPVKDVQHDRDIDYTRLMDQGGTLNADLTDSSFTQDESNLIALSHYLYGHQQPLKRISMEEFVNQSNGESLYMEYRSVAARRAAAQNSYNTLAAMRMAGSGASETYMKDILKYIGISDTDANIFLGGKTHPDFAAVKSSYNAQMNLLTKQIYQDPAFYANLMDSKTNVKRTSAAIQGIGLMQQRDTYRSMARSEMLAALLVELEARKIANNVTAPRTTATGE